MTADLPTRVIPCQHTQPWQHDCRGRRKLTPAGKGQDTDRHSGAWQCVPRSPGSGQHNTTFPQGRGWILKRTNEGRGGWARLLLGLAPCRFSKPSILRTAVPCLSPLPLAVPVPCPALPCPPPWPALQQPNPAHLPRQARTVPLTTAAHRNHTHTHTHSHNAPHRTAPRRTCLQPHTPTPALTNRLGRLLCGDILV